MTSVQFGHAHIVKYILSLPEIKLDMQETVGVTFYYHYYYNITITITMTISEFEVVNFYK